MGIKNEDDNKSPRKPFIYYYLIVMIVMILFNALMVPWIQSRTVTVSYTHLRAHET